MAPVKPQPKLARTRYTDPTIINRALERIRRGEISVNRASKIYGIPQSTLWDKHHGRRPVIGRSGPKTTLTNEEEDLLANWLIEMSRIGYPLTRAQLQDTVKKILDKDERQNPFIDNRPGRKWTELFFKRHPQITCRIPEHLGKERAVVDFAKIEAWFKSFWRYAEEKELLRALEDPTRLFNADESGFPLNVKTGRVIAELGAKNVYSLGNSSKTQITVLACCNAAGFYVPPMMVFPGQRFIYNPLEGAPEGSFLGRSHNGWMDSDVFFKWVANHFLPSVQKAGVIFPIILFVDGHASHLNLETCKFCRDNGIVLYCLPSNSSHIMQPLDLSVFGPLKGRWRKAVQQFQLSNIGEVVEKWTFSKVFNEAWKQSCTKKNASSGFRKAGLFPFSLDAIDKQKLKPSRVFHRDDTNHHWAAAAQEPAVTARPESAPAPDSAATTPEPAANAEVSTAETLVLIESLLGEQRLSLYERHYDSGCNPAEDSQYMTWSKLKAKAMREQLQSRPATSKHPCLSPSSRLGVLSMPVKPSSSTASSTPSCSTVSSTSAATSSQDVVSPVFHEHLRLPKKRKTFCHPIKTNPGKCRRHCPARNTSHMLRIKKVKAALKEAKKR